MRYNTVTLPLFLFSSSFSLFLSLTSSNIYRKPIPIHTEQINPHPAILSTILHSVTGFERRTCPSGTRNRGSSLAMEHGRPRNTLVCNNSFR